MYTLEEVTCTVYFSQIFSTQFHPVARTPHVPEMTPITFGPFSPTAQEQPIFLLVFEPTIVSAIASNNLATLGSLVSVSRW